MNAIKNEVISLVQQMPEYSTLEDIMEQLYVMQKIRKGKKQLSEGQFYSHEEAKEMLNQWLK
jgi:hypothetical protein